MDAFHYRIVDCTYKIVNQESGILNCLPVAGWRVGNVFGIRVAGSQTEDGGGRVLEDLKPDATPVDT